MQTFRYHIDSCGGAWLEVSDAVVAPLNIAEQISGLSRHFAGRFFLDSHGDTKLFLDAYRARYGEPNIKHILEKGESAINLFPVYDFERLNDRTRRALRLNRVA